MILFFCEWFLLHPFRHYHMHNCAFQVMGRLVSLCPKVVYFSFYNFEVLLFLLPLAFALVFDVVWQVYPMFAAICLAIGVCSFQVVHLFCH